MAKSIRKALIPAAGLGTRFLPQTKAMPKEMMPLVDKPIIQRVVEELVEAGIETVVIVTGWHKRSIEDHFDNQFELEEKLYRAGKIKELEIVRKISEMAEFVYIRQKGPLGNATPILNVKHIMGQDPFIVCWGDDFVDAEPTLVKQLIKAYQKYGCTVLGAIHARSNDDYKKYGFIGGDRLTKGVFKIRQVIEKPGTKENAPSDLAIVSGFIVTHEIYPFLEDRRAKLKRNQELIYTYGLEGMIKDGIDVLAVELANAIYRDTGNKLEYLKTVVEYGLKHPEFGSDFAEFLKNRSK